MKALKKAMALFLAMLMILAVTPVSVFAEEADVPAADAPIDESEEALNPFSLIGKFFETIGNVIRLVVEFLENMFSGTGNDALEQL